ncbi:hypothetical protein GFL68_28245 [Rhizobium laguerreae]|uniref:PIN-like domain-containing protein n=1 Tax=Rhizobium laguerreae TaxID=1076926 RepID=UPI001441BF54|nr:PIN-like domain-containing protein [Rhizobium laguerreae]NKM42084.1 hypothetical protein [Rhizobium laguerreae]
MGGLILSDSRMLFPEIAPSRSEIQRLVVESLKAPNSRVYVDSSVLIHCYEMSRSACEELLAALDSLGEGVKVPMWCAKETWEHYRGLTSKRPLQKTAGLLNKRLSDFRNHSLRYVDERTFSDLSVEEYTNALEAAVTNLEQLVRRVEKIEPSHDAASARLIPFITDRALNSDMAGIYAEIQETGEARYTHEVPPGFGDGGTRNSQDGDDESDDAPVMKGKKRNRYGDLITWLEVLGDCQSSAAEHLIVLTRDNTKKDWAHNPERVTGDDGKLQLNGGLITLPLPMLVQEAKRRCNTVKAVHVISLELFTQIMRVSFGARVGNLARALQASSKSSRSAGPVDTASARAPQSAEGIGELRFGSVDMMFEPSEQEASLPIWQVLSDLKSDGWTIQNAAASRLPELIANASDVELKQIGRGLMSASNEDALGPVEMAVQIVEDNTLDPHTKANVIIGLLAETYFDENGEPKKPVAHPDIVASLFAHGNDAITRRAFEIVVSERLAPVKRLYLALPGEDVTDIRIEVITRAGQLVGIQANDKELLENNVPPTRQLPTAGATIPLNEVLGALAREFVVPGELLKVEGPSNFEVTIPERMGFLAWGPNTGEQLR